jgi:hypothetical protein
MKDIDFDELDKAVSSLMGTVASIEDDDSPKEKTFTVSSTLKPGEKPAYERIEAAAMRIGNETLIGQGERTTVEDLDTEAPDTSNTAPAVQAAPEVNEEQPQGEAESSRPEQETPTTGSEIDAFQTTDVSSEPVPKVQRPASGRFMDVVHPSSDMRTSTPTPRLIVPERAVPGQQQPAAVPVVPPVEMPAPPLASSAPEVEASQEGPIVAVETASETTDQPIESAPLTPFLPDAKVEKRPLGDMPGIVSSTDQPDSTDNETDQSADAPTVTNGEVDETGYEMGDDSQLPLNASDFNEKQTDAEKQLRAIEDGAQPSPENDELEKQSDASPEISVRAVESGDTEGLSKAAQSGIIVNPVDETNPNNPDTDIFDVKEYHQPLDHPVKQKSGWGTVLIIVIIIVICAGIGAATYFALGMGTLGV